MIEVRCIIVFVCYCVYQLPYQAYQIIRHLSWLLHHQRKILNLVYSLLLNPHRWVIMQLVSILSIVIHHHDFISILPLPSFFVILPSTHSNFSFISLMYLWWSFIFLHFTFSYSMTIFFLTTISNFLQSDPSWPEQFTIILTLLVISSLWLWHLSLSTPSGTANNSDFLEWWNTF